MPTIIKSYDEFKRENGGHPIRVGDRILFATGAFCNDYGIQAEPPQDDVARLVLQKEYWTERLARAESDFYETKETLNNFGVLPNINLYYPDLLHGKSPADALKALRKHVLDCRDALKQIERDWQKTDEYKKRQERIRQRQERERREEERLAKIREEIEDIEI